MIFNSTEGKLTMESGGTPVVAEVTPGEGNFSMDGLQEKGWSTEVVRNRGAIIERVYVQEEEVSGGFSILADGKVTDGTAILTVDAALKKGTFLAADTVEPGGRVWTTTLKWEEERVVGSTTTTNLWTIPNARVVMGSQEGTPANLRSFTYTAPAGAVLLATTVTP